MIDQPQDAVGIGNPHEDVYTRQLMSMIDIFGGEELRAIINSFLADAEGLATKQISVEYLKTLGKIKLLNSRMCALYDFTLHVGPLTVRSNYQKPCPN